MMALYRIVEPSGGRIIIDGCDTSQIGLTDLRSRLALVPQVRADCFTVNLPLILCAHPLYNSRIFTYGLLKDPVAFCRAWKRNVGW